jgi:hypothetical protein
MIKLTTWEDLKQYPLLFKFYSNLFASSSEDYKDLSFEECAGGATFILETEDDLDSLKDFNGNSLHPSTISNQVDAIDAYEGNIIITIITNNGGGDGYVCLPSNEGRLRIRMIVLFNNFNH